MKAGKIYKLAASLYKPRGSKCGNKIAAYSPEITVHFSHIIMWTVYISRGHINHTAHWNCFVFSVCEQVRIKFLTFERICDIRGWDGYVECAVTCNCPL